MNSRTQTFDLQVEGRQIDEAVASLFHTVLLHRTLGKFTFNEDGSYSVGTLGIQDVDCDFIDITYVCCSSFTLNTLLKNEISKFSDSLRKENNRTGQITLEFFQRKSSHWPFQPQSIPWEVWNIRIEMVKLCNEYERQLSKETVGEKLGEKMMLISEIMNRHEYLPCIPPPSELGLIFDTSYPDVQPYLFRLDYFTSDSNSPSVGSTVCKLIKETLSFN